jgi:hypothetical protein
MTLSPSFRRRVAPRKYRPIPSVEILVFFFLVVQYCFFSWRNLSLPAKVDLDSNRCDLALTEASSNGHYKVYQSRSLPCDSHGEKDWKHLQNEPSNTGLMYMNLIHSDDDIVASVALQIAQPPSCSVRVGPVSKTAHMMKFGERNNQTSFLFSFLRSPTERAIRDFFHHMVTMRRYEPSDHVFQAYLEERGYSNRNLQELALQEYYPGDGGNEEAVVESIVQGYDFLGISERRDESLVVLKLLLGLNMTQILYLQNPTPFVYEDTSCFLIAQPFVSPDMRAYLSESAWQDRTKGDMLLYQTANRSLDKTIEHLGRAVVEKELQDFRLALQYTKEVCVDKVAFLCNYNGIWQRGVHKCMHERYGCASRCLNSKEIVERVDK